MHLFADQGCSGLRGGRQTDPCYRLRALFRRRARALERVAAEVAHACENVGFFYVLNHGVLDALIDRAFAASHRFHALPLAEKLALKLNDNNIGCRPLPWRWVSRPISLRRSLPTKSTPICAFCIIRDIGVRRRSP